MPEVYRAVCERAGARNIRMLNPPEAHLDVLEMDRATPLLGALTPKTAVVTSLDELEAAARAVGGFPVFVKGNIKSRKEVGWDACVAQDLAALRFIGERILADLEVTMRNKIVVRALAPLKRRAVGDRDFLVGREFRVFLLDGEPLAHAFYWPYLMDGYFELDDDEERAVLALASEAARRLPAPYVTIDVAQREDDAWIVVEPGDGQFAGLNLIGARDLWGALVPRLRAHALGC